MSQFIPDERLIIDTIVETWFDKYNRQLCGSRPVEDLKESLWLNLKPYLAQQRKPRNDAALRARHRHADDGARRARRLELLAA